MVEARANELRNEIEDALALVSGEAPLHFAAMRGRLGVRAAVICVGAASRLRLCIVGEPPWVELCVGDDVRDKIEVTLSEGELGRLLRGESSIDDGILNGSLSVRGALGDLLAFFDGLSSWLHGALRSPSLPKLHEHCLVQNAAASSAPAGGKEGMSPC